MTDRSRYQQTMATSPTRALAAALLALAICAAPAGALPATYDGIAADGHLSLFSTAEQMVPGDTDNEQDVYVRAYDGGVGEYVTREVSIGPLGGNDAYPVQYDGVSSDGARVFFSTDEPLVAADADHSEDVYMRDLATNTTTLVSRGDSSCAGEGCGGGAIDAGYVPGGVVPAGSRVFFATTEKLNSADGDKALDVYVRDLESNETLLVSAGDSSCAGSSCGNGSVDAFFKQASEDGEKVFFTSTEGLVAGDGDGQIDIYERDLGAGETALVSVAGTCPATLPEGQNCNPTFGGASGDGSHVFFESNERISEADTDNSQDVYGWSGSGAATLASTGPSGGNGAFNATYSGASADGATVYFETSEALDPGADGDAKQDVYARTGETTTLISTGPEERNGPAPAAFRWASPDGSSAAVLFSTAEALVPEDEDAAVDVYERSGGETILVSTGPDDEGEPLSATFALATNDGSGLFFVTAAALVEEDEDEAADIYLRSNEETTLVSTGPIGGNGAFTAGLHGVSSDGSQAFFVTKERLTVDDDFAGEDDVYQWSAGKSGSTTLLVSVKNSGELVLGPPPPTLEGTSPPSPGETTEPRILGQAEEGATITIYTSSSCSGEAVPPGGSAEELAGVGIPVTVAAGSKTTFYATAEVEGIVSPCSNGIAYKQEVAPEEGGGGKEEGGGSGEEGGGGGKEEGGGSGGGSGGGGSIDPSAILGAIGSGGGGSGGAPQALAYVTPHTRITFGPGAKTRRHKVVFRFADSTGQPGTRFRCKLDRRPWRKCGSPKRLKKLRRGRHVFRVKAVNAVGAWEGKPQKRAFKVVR